MIKRRILHFIARNTTTCTEHDAPVLDWELRPGGMLVQRRIVAALPPDLQIHVDCAGDRFQISTNSHSTFGQLKKLLEVETGLHPSEQRLVFRGTERKNGEYLDACGVKNRSKISVTEDPESQRRKLLETRRVAKIQAAHRFINSVSTEIDTLAEQVSVIEKSIASGSRVAEVQITTLTEMLMRQAVKLDAIAVEEDDTTACEHKYAQGKRVQRCVETLDDLNKLLNNAANETSVPAKWDKFHPSTPLIQWELFDW